MSKTYYTSYADHCLKYYVRYSNNAQFNSATDRDNWKAAYDAIQTLKKRDKDFILDLYKRNTKNSPYHFKVEETAKRMSIPVKEAWRIIITVQKDVAKRRGLV